MPVCWAAKYATLPPIKSASNNTAPTIRPLPLFFFGGVSGAVVFPTGGGVGGVVWTGGMVGVETDGVGAGVVIVGIGAGIGATGTVAIGVFVGGFAATEFVVFALNCAKISSKDCDGSTFLVFGIGLVVLLVGKPLTALIIIIVSYMPDMCFRRHRCRCGTVR